MSAELSVEDVKKEAEAYHEARNINGKRLQLISFKLNDGGEYALQIDQIKEVVITPKNIAKVAHVPPYIKGIANIRGNIIAIIDLEEKFNLPQVESSNEGNYTLVVESEEYKMGILVTHVPNTLTIYEQDIETDSSVLHLTSIDRKSIKGIVRIEDRLLFIVDLLRLMKTETVHI